MPNYSLYSTPPSPFSPFEMGNMGQWGMPTNGMAPPVTSTAGPMDISGMAHSPTAPNIGAGFSNGFGLNMDTAKLALSGLGTIGNLWAAFNAQKLAREQFNYTKGVTDTNIANQIKTYNTGLDDRIRSRAAVEGMSASDAKAYIDKNSLSRFGK